MVIAGLYLASNKSSFWNKFLFYLSIVPFFIMTMATLSATLSATFTILFILFIFLSFVDDKKIYKEKLKK